MQVFSHSLQGKRESNEDQHEHILNIDNQDPKLNPVNFFAVFDGHGGKGVSKYLKDNLPKFFVNKFKKNIYIRDDAASTYFNMVFESLQSELSKSHPRVAYRCGSTACVGIMFKDNDNTSNPKTKLWLLNVGDSRAVKCSKTNIAEQLTQDHKPNSPEERVRIEGLGGKLEFDGCDWRIKNLSLSRAFGDLDTMPYVTHLPQIYKYKISSSDKFLIFACDGVWDVISNQDAVDHINNKLMDPQFKGDYAKSLTEYAYEKGSTDNITAIVYLL